MKPGKKEQGPSLGLRDGAYRTAMVSRGEIEILRLVSSKLFQGMIKSCLSPQHPVFFPISQLKCFLRHLKDLSLLKAEGRSSREQNSCSLLAVHLLLFLVLCTWIFPSQEAGADDKATYIAATSGTSWTVPNWVTSITVKTWGAGGGGGGSSSSYNGGAGAGAGFAQATISVTPGETLTIKVGGGGSGGKYNTYYAGGGGGGGYSGVFRSSTALIIAAGGGGGGGGGSGSNYSSNSFAGGVGGGDTGGNGGDYYYYGYYSGRGGTQSAGGAAGDI